MIAVVALALCVVVTSVRGLQQWPRICRARLAQPVMVHRMSPLFSVVAGQEQGQTQGQAQGQGQGQVSTVEEEIDEVVGIYTAAEASPEGIGAVNPTLLLDTAHFLVKGRLYEKVMKRRIEGSETPEQAARLESVDRFLHGFVQAERKSRSRLKVNYIMAGAASGRLDDSIELLHEADEIDEDLLLYLSSLLGKQLLRSGGPTAESDRDLPAGGSGQQSIEVLRLVYKRLEAQLKTRGNKELALLARVVAEDHPERREALLRARLSKVEDMEDFAFFLQDGIQHMTKAASAGGGEGQGQGQGENQGQGQTVGQLERIKDVLLSVQQLMGRNQDEVFATDRSGDAPGADQSADKADESGEEEDRDEEQQQE